jgi:exopolyphosphatase/guanosine-5'-triphosphate,3'-diphosphate pyrophosphatase
VLLRLFAIAKFRDICFTTYGLREGVAIVQQGQHHPTGHNSLMATCKALAMQSGRFGLNGDEVFEFLRPFTLGLPPNYNKLFHAACWISDMGWSDHPEERAKQIFNRILHAPLLAIDHHGRAFMALLCYSRYAGKADKVKEMTKILNHKEFQLAMRLGLALRFADTVCGGVPHILPKLKFTVSGKSMMLQTPKTMAVAGGDEVHKRLENLADAFNMSPMIIQAGAR